MHIHYHSKILRYLSHLFKYWKKYYCFFLNEQFFSNFNEFISLKIDNFNTSHNLKNI